jgi:tartrate-resistant acid phosphatase type 5
MLSGPRSAILLHSRREMLALVLVALAVFCLSGRASAPAAAQTPEDHVRFVVIGDYGSGGRGEAAVAEMVKAWEPDFIVTTGDNNYPDGAASTIDAHVGQFYHDFIYPYHGRYGVGAATNRFFPTLGNHDWSTADAQPYLDYFTLPGNERYYDLTWGPVHLFALDSDYREPDGISATSEQAKWLKERLAASTEPWNLVCFHVPPYSSGLRGSTSELRWPFQGWGATAVLTGHDHTYERIVIDSFPYFVNGLGDDTWYVFKTPVKGSAVRYNRASGAMLVEADERTITFEFWSVVDGGTLVDRYTITGSG